MILSQTVGNIERQIYRDRDKQRQAETETVRETLQNKLCCLLGYMDIGHIRLSDSATLLVSGFHHCLCGVHHGATTFNKALKQKKVLSCSR